MRKYNSSPVGRSKKSKYEHISKSMRSNKSSGTKPELILSKLLRKRIYKNKLPGNPDFIYRNKKLAIFVHGCFWHRCPRCNLPLPKSNRAYWKRKFERNVERDMLDRRELRKMGWKVLTVWEHDIRKDPEKQVSIIKSKFI